MKKLSFIFMLSLAVLTFGFMVNVTGCHNSLTGTDFKELSASASNSSINSITVYFNIKNGGWGLTGSYGTVIARDGSYYNFNRETFASNFSISLVLPSEETYVKIYWSGEDLLGRWTYLSAKLNVTPGVSNYIILINYNGRGKVVTENLDDVLVWK